MAKHKAGLHKEVARIFDGVWTPQIDNIQQSPQTSIAGGAACVNTKPITMENWSVDLKPAKSAKPSKRVSWNIFSPKARRERKRLSSISKNLLINLPAKDTPKKSS